MVERKSTPITDELYDYLPRRNPPLDPVQRALVRTAHERLPEHAGMQSAETRARCWRSWRS